MPLETRAAQSPRLAQLAHKASPAAHPGHIEDSTHVQLPSRQGPGLAMRLARALAQHKGVDDYFDIATGLESGPHRSKVANLARQFTNNKGYGGIWDSVFAGQKDSKAKAGKDEPTKAVKSQTAATDKATKATTKLDTNVVVLNKGITKLDTTLNKLDNHLKVTSQERAKQAIQMRQANFVGHGGGNIVRFPGGGSFGGPGGAHGAPGGGGFGGTGNGILDAALGYGGGRAGWAMARSAGAWAARAGGAAMIPLAGGLMMHKAMQNSSKAGNSNFGSWINEHSMTAANMDDWAYRKSGGWVGTDIQDPRYSDDFEEKLYQQELAQLGKPEADRRRAMRKSKKAKYKQKTGLSMDQTLLGKNITNSPAAGGPSGGQVGGGGSTPSSLANYPSATSPDLVGSGGSNPSAGGRSSYGPGSSAPGGGSAPVSASRADLMAQSDAALKAGDTDKAMALQRQASGVEPGGPSTPSSYNPAAPQGGQVKPGSLAANQKEAYDSARAEGLSHDAAKTLVANMTGESLRNPSDHHWDSKHMSQGIVQWDPQRAAAIEKQFGKLPKDMTVAEQTKASLWEMKNNKAYKATWDALNDPNGNHQSRMAALVRNYERPANQGQGQIDGRLAHLNGMKDIETRNIGQKVDAKQTGPLTPEQMVDQQAAAGRAGQGAGLPTTPSTGATGGSNVIEAQGKEAAIRRQALAADTRDRMEYAAQQAGVQVRVTSGGQDDHGSNRTGSHRHDHGGAGDFDLMVPDGKGGQRKLSMDNPADVPKIQQFVQAGSKAGLTGWGMGKGYMGDSKIHAGGGSEAVWGGGPDWFKKSVDAGKGQRGDFSLEQFRKEQAAKAEAAKNPTTPSAATPSGAAPGFGDGFGNAAAKATPSAPADTPATGAAAAEVNASRARLASPPPVGGDPMGAVSPNGASTQTPEQTPTYDAMGNVTGVTQPDTVSQEVDKAKALDSAPAEQPAAPSAPSAGGGGGGGGKEGYTEQYTGGGSDEFSPLLAVMASTMFGQGAA